MSTEYIFSIIINSKFDIFVCIYCKHYKIKAFEKRLYKVKILYGTSSYLNLYISIYMYTHFKYIYRDYLRQWVHYFDRHWNCGSAHAQTGEQQSLSALFSAAFALYYSRYIRIYDWNEYAKEKIVNQWSESRYLSTYITYIYGIYHSLAISLICAISWNSPIGDFRKLCWLPLSRDPRDATGHER